MTAARPLLFLDVDGPLNPYAADHAYAAEHTTAPFLLQSVSPRVGLLADDFRTLTEWALSIEPAPKEG
jgi:hypothetical protein